MHMERAIAQSSVQKALHLEKYTTLFSITLLVTSNTLLLVNVLLFFSISGTGETNVVWDPQIVGFNLDSIITAFAVITIGRASEDMVHRICIAVLKFVDTY